MKTWLIAIACLILFIGAAIFLQIHIQRTSERFEETIKTVNRSLARRQWAQTLKELHTIEHRWRKTKPKWAMLIHHREIDNIDQSLIRTIKATQSKNFSEAQMELGTLKLYIHHIPEQQKFSLVNIL